MEVAEKKHTFFSLLLPIPFFWIFQNMGFWRAWNSWGVKLHICTVYSICKLLWSLHQLKSFCLVLIKLHLVVLIMLILIHQVLYEIFGCVKIGYFVKICYFVNKMLLVKTILLCKTNQPLAICSCYKLSTLQWQSDASHKSVTSQGRLLLSIFCVWFLLNGIRIWTKITFNTFKYCTFTCTQALL